MSPDTIKLLAATAELLNTALSEAAVLVMLEDLSPYPDEHVQSALKRLRLEGGRCTSFDIIKRLPSLWPGAEEAWARFPREESDSGCVCAEMLEAWGAARGLDSIAARMAFRETYQRLVALAMGEGARPRWVMSLGTDPTGHEPAALDALERGLLTPGSARGYLPSFSDEELTQLSQGRTSAHKLLEGSKGDPGQVEVAGRALSRLLEALRAPIDDPDRAP